MINQKYRLWCENATKDPDLIEELKAMEGNEALISDAFYKDLEFGTAGMRGILGVGTSKMNVHVVAKATLGFGRYLESFDNAHERGVVISHDNRRYSKEFALDTAKVFTTIGFKVYLFSSLRPTPELSFAVRELGATAGITSSV
mgnify:CR=1 FL=1